MISASSQHLQKQTDSLSTVNKCSKKITGSLEHIYSRKKRYLLFPDGSSIVATFSDVKAIQTKYPRGVNLILEADFIYPLQSKISDWYPKKIKNISVQSEINWSKYNNIISDKDNSPSQWWTDQQLNQSIVSDRNQYNIPYHSRKKPYVDYFNAYSQKSSAAYRHRRSLYQQFESLAMDTGININGCILRLICEVQHYLLPPGKSFFQDVLRIFFQVPTGISNNTSDKYSRAMRSTKQDCIEEYRKICQYSILGFLLHPNKETII